MKTRLFLCLLGLACLLTAVKSQCKFPGSKKDVEFPDIMKYVADSYVMGVEYSVPGAKQTDYYTEYYEEEFKRGRIDGHQAGDNFQFIYRAESWETWTLKGNECNLINITVTPEFMKDDMEDWMHSRGTEMFTTIGPSAMFKIAYDVWKNQGKERKMAYMGPATIRGEIAVYWRRCINETNYVDYYFAAEDEENPFDTDVFKKKITPLRVAFNMSEGMEPAMSKQYFEILSFQHQIPPGVEPFQLPKGKNCKRGALEDAPDVPDFSNYNILMSAEVLYKKISTADGDETLSSYYSTLTFALDRELNHLTYFYSSWNTSKPDKDHEEPFLNAPHYTVFDLTHKFAYRINYETNKCTISRDPSFFPSYKLPEKGGSLSLSSTNILIPSSELTYLTKGTDRGLAVDIFETESKGYPLDKDNIIDRAIITQSFLTRSEEIENTVAIKRAPTQIEFRLFRKKDTMELLTFNIFGFTTKIPKRARFFDVSRCFKNDDDYTYLSVGFEADPRYLTELEKKLPEIEENVINEITMKSELNVLRIPKVMTDMKDGYIYVTMLILQRPPVQLDFSNMEEGMTIPVTKPDDTQGISNFGTCANNCLETRSGCWGFSLCGGTCYFGSVDNTKVEAKSGCTLYRRFNNDSFIQSKELQVSNVIHRVEAEELMTVITLDSGERVELKATVAQETDPGQDDSLFEKMGNLLNPRMRVFKPATKLKKGTAVKNLGKLRYDECQTLCLDFKSCETLSYCLIDGRCTLSNKYSTDLSKEETEPDDLCNLLTRKYTDHFERTPGVSVNVDGGTVVKAETVEDCAKECLKADKKCLSFDHCAGDTKDTCKLYSVHFLNTKSIDAVKEKNPRCGHYTKKLSNEFKKKLESRIVGGSFISILNLTLEECAKRCIEYGQGACYGYDFCQDTALYATSCVLFDTDPSRYKSTYSPICTNYLRSGSEYAPRPYSNSYAGGIGFLCFLVGGVVGVVAVFVIAYIRVNRR